MIKWHIFGRKESQYTRATNAMLATRAYKTDKGVNGSGHDIM
jgi:hypothetical protein